VQRRRATGNNIRDPWRLAWSFLTLWAKALTRRPEANQEQYPMEWFYRLNGKETGPISANDLKQLYTAKTITAKTRVRRGDMPDWQPLRHFVKAAAPKPAAEASAVVHRPRSTVGIAMFRMRPGLCGWGLDSIRRLPHLRRLQATAYPEAAQRCPCPG
jgi:hypothetical protein